MRLPVGEFMSEEHPCHTLILLSFFFGYYGWTITACFFAFNGQRDGSLRIADSIATIGFRKHMGERTFGAMMCIISASEASTKVLSMKCQWAEIAHEALNNGKSVTVQPRGHSMTGLIADDDVVTLEPFGDDRPAVGDIVFARVSGRRFRHLVLHQILAQDAGRYLIGNSQGRPDGWIAAQEIFGRATKITSVI